ncbi:MAG TPA: M56 family metallopeptidase [Gemmataceae bacterium]|nr:M56 family metallopeptidase [Gemmataceae bacterium]
MNDLLSASASWSETWGQCLWRASWQGTLVLLAAWAIARWCTFLSPRVVCWMWRLACIKILVALVWVQPVAIPLLASNSHETMISQSVSLAAPEGGPVLELQPVLEDRGPMLVTDSPQSHLTWCEVLLALWATGVCCCVIRTVKHWSGVQHLCRSGRPVESSSLHRLCQEIGDRTGIRRLPRLRLAPSSAGPFLAGIWHPTIVLPDSVDARYDESELRLILAHELAHLKRRDLLWNWLPTFVDWLFFFHPLVWVMARSWLEVQEAACDELVIQNHLARPAEYGHLLLKISVNSYQEPRASTAKAGVLGPYRTLERRILAMTRIRPYSRGRLLCMAAFLAVLGTVVSVPWRLVADERTFAKNSGQQGSVQAPAGPGKLLIFRNTKYVFVTPDGKEIADLPGQLAKPRQILTNPALSPDARRVAFYVPDPDHRATAEEGFRRGQVSIRPLDGQGAEFRPSINPLNMAWTPDGKGLIVAELIPAKELKDSGFTTWLVDPSTKKQIKLDLPRWANAFGMTPDGKSYVAAVYDIDARKIHVALVSRDGKSITNLTEIKTEGPNPKISPDGAFILFLDTDPADKPEGKPPARLGRLFVYDLQKKTRKRLDNVPSNAFIMENQYCWSPDGKRLAYVWKRADPGVPLVISNLNMNDPKMNAETESFLMIADADGTNAKTLLSGKGKGPDITLGDLDWR